MAVVGRVSVGSAAKRLVAKLAEIDANVNPVLAKEHQLFELEEKKKALVGLVALIEALDARILSLSKDDKEYETLYNAIQDVNDVYINAILDSAIALGSQAKNRSYCSISPFFSRSRQQPR